MKFFVVSLALFLPSTNGFLPSRTNNNLQQQKSEHELNNLPSFSKSKSSSSSSSALKVAVVAPEALQGAWTAYNEALEANPLLVKSVTAGVILGAADVTGQVIEDVRSGKSSIGSSGSGSEKLDLARTARFAFFGLVLQAPWNHFYYQFLDGAIPPTEDPLTPTTAIKTVIDQFVQAPIFTVLIFTFLGFLEGKSMSAISEQLDRDYKDTMIANCKLLHVVTCELESSQPLTQTSNGVESATDTRYTHISHQLLWHGIFVCEYYPWLTN